MHYSIVSVSLVALITAVASIAAGCAPQQLTPYPESFPALVTPSEDCSGIGGLYKVVGISTDSNPDWRVGRAADLVTTLGAGPLGWGNPFETNVVRIEVDSNGRLVVHALPAGDLIELPDADYSCKQGVFTIERMDIPTDAEACTVKRSVTLEVRTTVDRDLAIAMKNAFGGRCYLIVPHSTEERYWYLFQRVEQPNDA